MNEEKFEEFKLALLEIAENELNACSNFRIEIEKCNNTTMIVDVMRYFVDEIFDELGGEHDFDEYENTVYLLENEIDTLYEKIEELEYITDTVYDEMKFNTFKELSSKYTPWEFEQLLLNGKIN
jgi:hypothetical protein